MQLRFFKLLLLLYNGVLSELKEETLLFDADFVSGSLFAF